mmetsp:Transcript_46368/g.110416  ORF Transcript_46368/g.110416 Transcript_46368/m.110416 type:complete len:336 (+) Transcript_46368:228-1235(+)
MPAPVATQHASSMTSIALSGSFRLGILSCERATAALTTAGEISTPWWAAYSGTSPVSISSAMARLGSWSSTTWKRRSNAASFERMSFLYSLVVVAPIHLNSPLASIGFMRFAASTLLLSDRPAPSTRCSSSMKSRIAPRDSFTCFSTSSSRSSKSPRKPVPASKAPMSSDHTSSHDASCEGTFPSAMHWATASATAVLPTPGSPTKQTLFFVLRDRICSTRSTSFSRPMTGSSLPSLAASTRFVPNLANAESGSVAARLADLGANSAMSSMASCDSNGFLPFACLPPLLRWLSCLSRSGCNFRIADVIFDLMARLSLMLKSGGALPFSPRGSCLA